MVLTGSARAKEVLKKYGRAGVVTYLSLSTMVTTGFYVAIKSNVDVKALVGIKGAFCIVRCAVETHEFTARAASKHTTAVTNTKTIKQLSKQTSPARTARSRRCCSGCSWAPGATSRSRSCARKR